MTTMKKALSTLEKYFSIDLLVIHSLDLCLYQASVEVDGQEMIVTNSDGSLLRTHSLLEMQKLTNKLNYQRAVMRQQSAYDEMVGGPEKSSPNTLEIPLVDNKLY